MFDMSLMGGKKKRIGKPNEWRNKRMRIFQNINSFINPDGKEEEVN